MPQLRGRATDRDRRELEVLHRVAVTLSQSLSLADVLTSLTRELVYGVDRAGEVAISLWNQDDDVLVDAACWTGHGPPAWRCSSTGAGGRRSSCRWWSRAGRWA